MYSKLALESQRLSQNDPELGNQYYRSGMIYAHAGSGRHGFKVWEKEYTAAQALQKQRVESGEFSAEGYLRHLTSHEALYKRVNGPNYEPHKGEKQWNEGYLNEDVAFVNAEECMRIYYQKTREQSNTNFVFGNPVRRLIVEGGVAKGVELADGSRLTADLVVLAAGAWTNTLLDLRDQVASTGHEVAWLKLSPELEERYKNMPVRRPSQTYVWARSLRRADYHKFYHWFQHLSSAQRRNKVFEALARLFQHQNCEGLCHWQDF